MRKRAEMMKLHKQLLRDDPQYREQWEIVTALFRTLLIETELPDEDTAVTSQDTKDAP